MIAELHHAVHAGDSAVVASLLSRRADADARVDGGGWTPLHVAAGRGHVLVVESLILARAQIFTLDRDGRSPLAWAERSGHSATSAILRRHMGYLGRPVWDNQAEVFDDATSQSSGCEARRLGVNVPSPDPARPPKWEQCIASEQLGSGRPDDVAASLLGRPHADMPQSSASCGMASVDAVANAVSAAVGKEIHRIGEEVLSHVRASLERTLTELHANFQKVAATSREPVVGGQASPDPGAAKNAALLEELHRLHATSLKRIDDLCTTNSVQGFIADVRADVQKVHVVNSTIAESIDVLTTTQKDGVKSIEKRIQELSSTNEVGLQSIRNQFREMAATESAGPSSNAVPAAPSEAASASSHLAHSCAPLAPDSVKGSTSDPSEKNVNGAAVVVSPELPEVVSHGAALPHTLASRIPDHDKRVLKFLLCFLESERIEYAPLFINGGYVRDLLLNKSPDDLDLSLGLHECPLDVTFTSLMENLPGFVTARPDLGIKEIKVATTLSNESKDKELDAFKGHFIDAHGCQVEVDIMPTIGEEKYEEGNRIPIRDQRGVPQLDALRRDLTIGAILLRVMNKEESLRYEVFDFFGGVEDLQRGILRVPCPKDKSITELRSVVLQSPESALLAANIGLDSCNEEQAREILWWAKVLMDDPLRVCRALRFAAKFRFILHDSFWQAVQFGLQALRSKVAGSRKNAEYLKAAGYGYDCCLEFFDLAFGRTFGPADRPVRLAPILFGGQNEKGQAKTLSNVCGFNQAMFVELAAHLKAVPRDHSAMLLAGLLCVAIFASDVEGDLGHLAEFGLVCDGMCVSSTMRDAGQWVLTAYGRLSAPAGPPVAPEHPGRLELAFAQACGLTGESMVVHLQVWNSLLFTSAAKDWPACVKTAFSQLALAMLQKADPQKADSLAPCVKALARERPPVKGVVLGKPAVKKGEPPPPEGVDVPPTLRARVMVLLEVSLRLLCCDEPLDDASQLSKLFVTFPALQQALSPAVWFEEDGQTLREEFAIAKKGKVAKK